MRFISTLVIAVTACAGLVHAEDQEPVKLEIHPRTIEWPKLKYRLLPPQTEIKPGDAVPILLRLPWEETPWMSKYFGKLSDWEELPLSAPDWKTSDGVLPENFYVEMRRAAYRRDAHWEYPLNETQNPYMILLPDVQGLRTFLGPGLSGRIRYHLTRGELDKAREGILVGLANSRHLSQTPFYVNQLVALSISGDMLHRVEELISQPGSPNLYWALSTLPPSMFELSGAANFEGDLFLHTVPLANDLDRPRDAAEWRKMATQLAALLQEYHDLPQTRRAREKETTLERLAKDVVALAGSPLAEFAKAGRPELSKLLNLSAEKVAAMGDDEVAIRWYIYRRVAHDQAVAAAMVLPPREAWPLLREAQAHMAALQTAGHTQWHVSVSKVYFSFWSFQRRIQAIRIVEAVRHYLGTHDGKLPATLDSITDLPIPNDPLTDQPFLWSVDGNSATLRSPSLPADAVVPEQPGSSTKLEYRLIVK